MQITAPRNFVETSKEEVQEINKATDVITEYFSNGMEVYEKHSGALLAVKVDNIYFVDPARIKPLSATCLALHTDYQLDLEVDPNAAVVKFYGGFAEFNGARNAREYRAKLFMKIPDMLRIIRDLARTTRRQDRSQYLQALSEADKMIQELGIDM